MKYAKIENNIVVQIQPNKQEGFIEVNDDIVCGMVKQSDDKFINPDIILTEEQLLQKAKAEGEVYTLNGVDYKVSFMKDDADGLMQVSMAFQLGLTNTVIHFENGTKMPIKSTEFEPFAIWFVGKRNSFFVEQLEQGGTNG